MLNSTTWVRMCLPVSFAGATPVGFRTRTCSCVRPLVSGPPLHVYLRLGLNISCVSLQSAAGLHHVDSMDLVCSCWCRISAAFFCFSPCDQAVLERRMAAGGAGEPPIFALLETPPEKGAEWGRRVSHFQWLRGRLALHQGSRQVTL